MTITDLLDSVLPRLTDKPQCSVLEAVRKAQSAIVNRLMLKRHHLLKDTFSTSVSAGDEYFNVNPSGGRLFLAIASSPYLTADRKFLIPYDDALTIAATGKPKYYQRTGKKITLYPVPDADYDIAVPTFLFPAPITDMGEELPFDGLLDDVFAEAVVGMMMQGTSAMANPAFVAVIDSQVDMALAAEDLADEQTLADSLNYR